MSAVSEAKTCLLMQCDLQSEACGQCIRAFRTCSGYRNTQKIRIRVENERIVRKTWMKAPHFMPKSLPLSMDWQARDAFFACYLDSKCWDFLKPYHHLSNTPEHLTLAIEAVSLAYLWHQVYSDAALTTARKRYISALRINNATLSAPQGATPSTALMATLLLDLFEKITNGESRKGLWTSHVQGALALVDHRGLSEFDSKVDLNMLMRLVTHHIVSCVASDSPIPANILAIQTYVSSRSSAQSPVLEFTDLLAQYANLRSKISSGLFSVEECIDLCTQVDGMIRAMMEDLPPSWQYKSIAPTAESERVFNLYYDQYSNTKVCQALNLLRVLRILLNELLINYHSYSPTESQRSKSTQTACTNINTTASGICASVPQYIECSPLNENHTHTPSHNLTVYTLIFPLYVAAQSTVIAFGMRYWIIEQLHHIGTHFSVRNAEIVAQMLEERSMIGLWDVYAMLGGYAFAS